MHVGLLGKAGFILGLLSGVVLTGLLPTILTFQFLKDRPRPPLIETSE